MLVSLDVALGHLKLPAGYDDDDIGRKVAEASSIVLDYLARPEDATWTATLAGWDEETTPADVQSAVLVQLGELYRFRGDDLDTPKRDPGFLSPVVVSLLRRRRDPVLR